MTKDELVAQAQEIFGLWNAHDASGLARFYANGATARLPASSMTSSAGVPTKIVEAAVSGTHTERPLFRAVPQALSSSSTISKNSRKLFLNPLGAHA